MLCELFPPVSTTVIMNNQVREIPGYYYGRFHKAQHHTIQPHCNPEILDQEKKKYFKVLPHGATPSGSAYSSAEVKKRKLQDERLEASLWVTQPASIVENTKLEYWKLLALTSGHRYEKARQKGRIRKAKCLNDPILGGVLSRELGSTQSNLDTSQIFAGGLIEQGSLISFVPPDLYQTALFKITPRRDLGHSLADFRMVISISIPLKDALYQPSSVANSGYSFWPLSAEVRFWN